MNLAWNWNRILAFLVAGGLALSASSCTENRTEQCRKVGEVVNSTTNRIQAIGTSKVSFIQGAQLFDQAARDLELVTIRDQSFRNLKAHLTAAYRDMSRSSREMAAIADASGGVTSSDPANSEVVGRDRAATQRFTTVVNGLQSYCNGGTLPTELTSAPASQ